MIFKQININQDEINSICENILNPEIPVLDSKYMLFCMHTTFHYTVSFSEILIDLSEVCKLATLHHVALFPTEFTLVSETFSTWFQLPMSSSGWIEFIKSISANEKFPYRHLTSNILRNF